YGHGTHVSGIAAAVTNNITGTAGVAWPGSVKVMPLKVCSPSGCPLSAIVSAIYYARNNGADVINMSLGGRFGSTSELEAIDAAWAAGLVIVASSGNGGGGKVSYPAAFSNVIAVGATDWHDQRTTYSNAGSALDVVAPGGEMSAYHDPGGIYSTMPGYDVYLTTTFSYSKNYDQLQGTSMSAPQVAGLAALLFAQDPSRTNAAVRAIIESTTDDLDKPGWDRNTGFGRINILRALGGTPDDGGGDALPTVTVTDPGADTTVSGTVVVTATAGDDNGGLEVEFFVDAFSLGVDMDGSDGWSRPWNTNAYDDGSSHSVTAVAMDTIGQTNDHTVGNVTVDNGGGGGDPVSAPTVGEISPATIAAGSTVGATITGSGFVAGATVSFANGSGPAPSAAVNSVSDSTISVTVTIKSGGPRRNRVWDVVVTNPDGGSGRLNGGLTITP
ncbi:MAG: S8 family serine peptidase, partial [Proteobacteria bacterium]|nr:S8 family serine peptidase [Pseudomonadota bacterium]